ncbi:hypothetical protein [Xanthomonas arboricola]|uniref:hypothetical protein n=1 Tax=Xanthomonas arboricola TaxID=56448 RepID=UPI001430BB44|nr:hypothetical protein [Xanthomonas arboricola]NJB78655.1 hypothetical protein [Xanthomonas arboricola]
MAHSLGAFLVIPSKRPSQAPHPWRCATAPTSTDAFTVLLTRELREPGFVVNAVNHARAAIDLNDHAGSESVDKRLPA